ncbi:LLM class flavin-dependent oxidoreductase [Phytoactinopolyspora halotolerans]|uniref:LLM class flavin-dependent oxidoreductase n=1 Tax=Phytoactinopolyspora halotolerans TaxID=1981512 RepID=A0A6L9SC48_9ACTN|nr:LLM class flavin-dependent oxidoreductase [Phytoactinopolyspora halotolerans]NEE01590.1 LLM class flavin-dependent oxidoreductase [Phytoactinopolyspora halotolerans]
MAPPLSILDLATVSDSSTPRDTLQASVVTAQRAEELGYLRYWFAEHHNMPSILSSAPSVLIAHIAAHTQRIRVGSGGVMLPNHSPLVIAEQFGTLETLYPGRIDLGVGRAPGGDQETFRALRRDPAAAEYFPQDVVELQALLGPKQPDRRVQAIPGADTNVPIYILGSSLFGAKLAAQLGLPYAFASHFAPAALDEALRAYRDEFQPSEQLSRPYAIAAMNVFAADSRQAAEALFVENLTRMARGLVNRGGASSISISDETLLASPVGQQVQQMLRHSAVGDAAAVKEVVQAFADHTQADEIIVASNIVDTGSRLRSFEILADAMHP